jgi:hypothetical protein
VAKQRERNDPSKTDPSCHANKTVKELMMAMNNIHAADIAKDNLNKLDAEGLTLTIDRLSAIQQGLEWEREQLEEAEDSQ